jgi:hypothetical protein
MEQVMNPEGLSYTQSLRAIGESLEAQGIRTFDLEKHGENYMLRVIASQPATGGSFFKKIAQLLWKLTIPLEPSDPAVPSQIYALRRRISRLVTEQQSRMAGQMSCRTYSLAQVLRVLGDHLDRKEAYAFRVSVSGDSLSVAYETGSGLQQRVSPSKIYMITPSNVRAGRNGERSTDHHAKIFTKRKEARSFSNDAMAEDFYLLLALCIAGTLRFVVALRARIRRRQQSRRMEEGIAKS